MAARPTARGRQDPEELADDRAAETGGGSPRRTPAPAEAGASNPRNRTESGRRVFTTKSGEPLDAANVRRDFRAIVKRTSLEPERTPRELRHSFVSLLPDHDIPLKRIVMSVRHSSQATTEAVCHRQPRPVITQGAEAMDEIFEYKPARTTDKA
ncbi:tyrosine-type recombinase/integrase [Streptomyces sp. ML-6]|nr:tyrosine-type recombinase/integrase [Streptomyces sp. ML-6]MDK0520432.1 tyrosine-type recombinase/integrase [Streptomyces sp. ML-6]